MAPADGDFASIEASHESTGKRTETSTSTHNDVDSGSGSENGEKPVREKLKQTELDETDGAGAVGKKRSLEGKDLLDIDEPSTPSGVHARKRSRDTRGKVDKRKNEDGRAGDLSGNESDKAVHSDGIYTPLSSDDESHGERASLRRPVKKRSYDDMDIYTDSDRERKIAATEQARARRSSSEGPNDNPEHEKFLEELKGNKKERDSQSSGASQSKLTKKRSREALGEDHEAVRKPTKKRSREALDEEYERDQKKTSSARQSRLKGASLESGQDLSKIETPQHNLIATSAQEGKEDRTDSEKSSLTEGPSAAVDSKTSSVQPDTTSLKTAENLLKTSSTAFAASGFATMTGSTSPFGTIGEKASTTSPFGALSASTTSTKSSADSKSPSETLPQTSSTAFAASGFASMTGSSSPFSAIGTKSSSSISTFGSAGHSPSKPVSAFSSLAGSNSNSEAPFRPSGVQSSFSALGSGIGGGFGGGSKLTSFAAPVGDTDLGRNTNAKPFGAPAEEGEDEDEEAEDNEEDDKADEERSVEGQVAASNGDKEEDTKQDDQSRKFKIKDVTETGEEGEESHFQGRGRLYHFVSGQWAEKGSGLIKLNMVFDNPEDEEQADDENRPESHNEEMKLQAARLIMRTAATHKVILNARIFKEMKIGDAAGNEPKGKSLLFSVPVEGKLVPHTLKMGQDGATQELYGRVKHLQAEM